MLAGLRFSIVKKKQKKKQQKTTTKQQQQQQKNSLFLRVESYSKERNDEHIFQIAKHLIRS